MSHKFKIAPAKDGHFEAKFVYNAEILVWSENYSGKASAKNCIESIKKHAPDAAVFDLSAGEEGAKGYRFEIVASKDEQFFVRFVAPNGETMVRSETYKAKASAKNCINSIKTHGPEAPVEDETASG